MKHYLVFLLLLIPMHSFAKDHLIATVGYSLGGSTVVEEYNYVLFRNNNSHYRLRAGDGLQSEFGYQVGFTDKVAVRFLIGYKQNTEELSDADHKITSVPASAFFLYTTRRVSFGGGISYHLSPTYTRRGDFSGLYNETAKFDDALGLVALLNIRLTSSDLFSLELRYTDITYEGAPAPTINTGDSTERSKTSYDASNIAILGIFTF